MGSMLDETLPNPPDKFDPTPEATRERDRINAINQRIFETSLDLILVCDKRGTFLRVSPSSMAIIGYDPAEMISRSARQFLHLDDLDKTRAEMQAARRGHAMRNFECRYVHRDGHEVPLAWAGIWSEREQQHFFIGRDITERKAIEQRLREAQRMDAIGRLTGGMAHDFNNLLGVIIGNLELASSRGQLDSEDSELVASAIEATLMGADLTRRLLAFARRQQLKPQRIEVNDLVRDVVGILGRTLGEHITISVRLAQDAWPVHADPAQLEASLVNLATNARDAMPRGGRLTITTANRHLDQDYASMHAELTPGDYAMIEVGDSGSGIPPEVISRIFDPFFTTKEPGKGTGLGLSMVFGFAKQSGGHINVYSEARAGTTFRLYLPRDRTAADTAETPTVAVLSAGSGETILVVEDNAAMRRVVVRQLTELGYRVIDVEDPTAALAALEREEVALLFSDIVMPGEMTGAELAQAAMARWPALKVILTSGFPEARVAGIGDTVAGLLLLSKPYRRTDLAAALRQVLDPVATPE
ncbi:MAG: ATP-binding protein [Stellaceae bacterium]